MKFELEPCPVCGKYPNWRYSKDYFFGSLETAYQYYCCGIQSSAEKFLSDARDDWNRVVMAVLQPSPPIGKTITIGKFVHKREDKDNEQA